MVEDFMIVIIMGASFSCKNFLHLVSMNFTVVPAANFFATGLYAPIRCRRQCEQLVLIEDLIGDGCGSLATRDDRFLDKGCHVRDYEDRVRSRICHCGS